MHGWAGHAQVTGLDSAVGVAHPGTSSRPGTSNPQTGLSDPIITITTIDTAGAAGEPEPAGFATSARWD